MHLRTAFAKGTISEGVSSSGTNLLRAFDGASALDMDDSQMSEASKRTASASPMKEKLDQLKRIRTAVAPIDSQTGMAAGGDATTAILDAIAGLSNKMDNMAADNRAMKSDLAELSATMDQKMKVTVAEAVDPLKSEVHDLKVRVQTLEAKPATTSASSVPSEVQSMIDNLDPAHRRIALLGFPQEMQPDARLKHIEGLLKKFPSFRAIDYGTICKGPHNDRKATRTCNE